MNTRWLAAAAWCALSTCAAAQAQQPPAAAYDAVLAQRLGGNDNGMRAYVLVILKTGPTPLPAGHERDEMFKGHFANIQRLSDDGKLVLAGPFDGVGGWRGLFIFAVPRIEDARRLAETDPVIAKGEMVAEYHAYYGSAALMLVPEVHARLGKPKP